MIGDLNTQSNVNVAGYNHRVYHATALLSLRLSHRHCNFGGSLAEILLKHLLLITVLVLKVEEDLLRLYYRKLSVKQNSLSDSRD